MAKRSETFDAKIFNVNLFASSKSDRAIRFALAYIIHNQGIIMSAISDFVAAQTAFNARMEASLVGIGGDIESLNAKITELQNSPGTITPEDQALLDQVQAQGEALAAKFEATDALTPPVAPPAP